MPNLATDGQYYSSKSGSRRKNGECGCKFDLALELAHTNLCVKNTSRNSKVNRTPGLAGSGGVVFGFAVRPKCSEMLDRVRLTLWPKVLPFSLSNSIIEGRVSSASAAFLTSCHGVLDIYGMAARENCDCHVSSVDHSKTFGVQMKKITIRKWVRPS